MAGEVELLECPICAFSVLPSEEYVLQLHFEQVHTTDSPFRIEDDTEPLPPPLPARPSSKRAMPSRSESPSSDTSDSVVECPVPDCGELIPLNDYNDHLDFHAASTLSFDEATGTYSSKSTAAMAGHKSAKKHSDAPSFVEQHFNTALPDALRRKKDRGRKLKKEKKKDRSTRESDDSARTSISRSILSFYPFKGNKIVRPPASNARLGRRELGPYAWEDRMPRWLHDQLAKGPKISTVNRIGRDGRLIKTEIVQNETPGIIPILAQLSALDHSVQEAYYCHPSTLHIGKTPNEGAFCGYRNIQMLLSYVQGSHAQGHEQFPGRTPGVLKLQDIIERAWDMGINSISRQQTGGIRDTRKYIGTPEAQALFLGSEIDCAVEQFCDQDDLDLKAHDALFAATESYFAQANANDGSNVHKTHLPPMYLQHEGHSLTIIGFERHRNGRCNLMVFDPSYYTSPAMHRLIGRKNIRNSRDDVMFAYRRGLRALGKYSAFEILLLTAPPPTFPAWDV
ncbi:peptidase family C78-domain-containing protein [Lophiotrema nucula]|uniref:Peptidase family C78-domain-containing protein n=1 Tax=Lophiotrema nucula TaxID=690887 RepID=A0A6A5YKT0_9PLEO|nr:peptidase family C78-domain-containing protein [Lophiotrema nucula]